MDEIGLRLALIIGMLAVAAVVTLVLRARARVAARKLNHTGLTEGVYFFTSSTCLDCGPARRKLDEVLGEGAYTEIGWERDPETFARLGIDAVPATLVVAPDGSGTLWPGDPGRALADVGP